jgi:hypothetical protein
MVYLDNIRQRLNDFLNSLTNPSSNVEERKNNLLKLLVSIENEKENYNFQTTSKKYQSIYFELSSFSGSISRLNNMIINKIFPPGSLMAVNGTIIILIKFYGGKYVEIRKHTIEIIKNPLILISDKIENEILKKEIFEVRNNIKTSLLGSFDELKKTLDNLEKRKR